MEQQNLDTRLSTLELSLDRIETKIDRIKKNKKSDDGSEIDFSQDENEERGNWSGKCDFLLACLGYAVGLGNVWRFPYLCYKNGGGAFFIPYAIMLFLVGIPIFFMELSLGQYTSSGPLTCWKFAPIFTGIGAGMVVVSAVVAIYYNMIIAWAIYYLFASFTTDLPWQHCGDWGTDWCANHLMKVHNNSHCLSMSPDFVVRNGVCFNETMVEGVNITKPVGIINDTLAGLNDMKSVLPAEEYLYGRVLGRYESEGLQDPGMLRWELCLCLLLAWIVVFFALINGVKSSGKVVYFTALFPYVVLLVFFIRAALLPNFSDGVRFYLNPDLSKLYDAEVWKDAAVQIFFSLSASWGGLITLASYNRFHTNTLRDTLIVSLGNCLTSFFAGFSVFGFLGYLAAQMGTTIDKVATSGVGLAFVVYPEAIMRIPGSVVWAILFFVMLITLGLDSEFALVETVITAIIDSNPNKLRKKKGFILLGLCIIFYLIGLVLCTNAGVLLLQLMDTYSGGWNVLLIAILECLAVGWFYGFPNYRRDILTMIGPNPFCCLPWMGCSYWWGLCWCFITPALCAVVIVFSLYRYTSPVFDGYAYPIWAEAIGWMFSLIVVAAIIITPIIKLCLGQEIGCRPSREWGPALVKHRKLVSHLPNFVVDPWGTEELADDNDNGTKYAPSGADNIAYEEDDAKTAL